MFFHPQFCALKMNMRTNYNMFCQTKKMNDPSCASKKDDTLFLPLTKKNGGIFYTGYGCDLDPLIPTYNNCNDDFQIKMILMSTSS